MFLSIILIINNNGIVLGKEQLFSDHTQTIYTTKGIEEEINVIIYDPNNILNNLSKINISENPEVTIKTSTERIDTHSKKLQLKITPNTKETKTIIININNKYDKTKIILINNKKIFYETIKKLNNDNIIKNVKNKYLILTSILTIITTYIIISIKKMINASYHD